jgi:threonine dehydrogenase-like Zn-dependent dehydrogenase
VFITNKDALILSNNKVLVVGARPVGLATACLLKEQGLDVLVVEQNKSPPLFSKAIGIIIFINFVPISAWVISLALGQVPSGNEMVGTGLVIISLLAQASITKYTFQKLAVKAS